MSNRIDIVNISLGMMGANPLTSLEDEANTAKLMKLNYDIARDATLEAYEWSFAIKRFEPALSTEEPLWEWSFAYPIPSEILRVLTVETPLTAPLSFHTSRGDMRRNQVAHVVESRQILTNEEGIFCTGIRRIEDEGIFSNLFVHAFAAKLAMLTCFSITSSRQIFDVVAAIYAGSIKEAVSRDSQQGTTRRLRSQWLRRVR